MNYSKSDKKRPAPLQIISPLHRVSRQLSIFLGAQFKDNELSGSEAHLLSYLQGYGPCPVTELVRVFGHKKATLTSMLDRLENRKLLRRALNPADRRSFLVNTTRRGDRVALEARRCVDDLDAELVKRVGARDLTAFHRVVDIVAKVTGVEVRPSSSHTTKPQSRKET